MPNDKLKITVFPLNSDGLSYEAGPGSLEDVKRRANEVAFAHVIPARISITHADYPLLTLDSAGPDHPWRWIAAGLAVDQSDLSEAILTDWGAL